MEYKTIFCLLIEKPLNIHPIHILYPKDIHFFLSPYPLMMPNGQIWFFLFSTLHWSFSQNNLMRACAICHPKAQNATPPMRNTKSRPCRHCFDFWESPKTHIKQRLFDFWDEQVDLMHIARLLLARAGLPVASQLFDAQAVDASVIPWHRKHATISKRS